MSGSMTERLKAQFGEAITVLENSTVPETVTVASDSILKVAIFCKDNEAMGFDALSCLTGIDYKDRIDVVYHLLSYKLKHELVLKVRLDRASPRLQTVEGVWKTANWHERECFDLLGVMFDGHPDLRRILLPDDWVGHPLRKDYVQPAEYHGISHTRIDPLGRPSPAITLRPAAGEEPRAN